jgi:hypothetical protein
MYIPVNTPEEWKQLLADPDKQWKSRHSAKALAYCWQLAKGFPGTVDKVFKESGIEVFSSIEVLFGMPEYRVPIKPYRSKASQNDIFVLAKGNSELVSIMVEGKVDEPFGELIGEWRKKDRGGKEERLKFLCETLDLDSENTNTARYQLVHRTASAVIEAEKFNAPNALMLVHIFKNNDKAYQESLEDYKYFTGLMGEVGNENSITYLKTIRNIKLYAGWVLGERRFLNR